MNLHRHIPNVFTSLNLATGVFGIINAFTGDHTLTIYYVLLAGIFDFLDGFLARMLKVSGDFGKELDSLADMVTFGILPSVFLFQASNAAGFPIWVCYSSVVVAVFSGIRLAQFNIDDSQNHGFKGLPTPANSIMLTTLGLTPMVVSNHLYFLTVVIISSYLLISSIPMIALKYKSFGFRGNEERYLFLLAVVGLMVTLGIEALPFVIPTYIVASVVAAIASRSDGKEA